MRHLALSAVLALAVAAPAMACQVPLNAGQLTHVLMLEINQERGRAGLPALRMSPQLSQAAQAHACDSAKANRMSHTGTDGSNFGQRIIRAGYNYRSATENVALGFPEPGQVVRAWMRSPGHRQNILARRPNELGLGVVRGRDGRTHWVMKSGVR